MTDSGPAVTEAKAVDLHPNLHKMMGTLLKQASLEEDSGDNSTFVMSIMENILAADSEEAIFAASESALVAGKDYGGIPFLLKSDGISWRRSDEANVKNGGMPIYAILAVTELSSGQERSIGCGGKTFVAQLYALQEKGAFSEEKWPDGRPLVINAKETTNGTRLSLAPYVLPPIPAGKKK